MKFLFKNYFFLLLICCQFNLAQHGFISIPNYKKIKENIVDKNSKLFFETLLQRYTKADSTMTLDEKQHLYYGYVFHKEGINTSNLIKDESKALNKIMNKINNENFKIEEAVNLTDSILKKTYFNFKILNTQLFLFDKIKNKKRFNETIVKIGIIFDAIVASGDGISEETPFYVTEQETQYDLLNILGFQFNGKHCVLKNTHIDYLEIAENKYNLKGLYFNASPSFWMIEKSAYGK